MARQQFDKPRKKIAVFLARKWKNAAEVARRLGIKANNVYRWMGEAQSQGQSQDDETHGQAQGGAQNQQDQAQGSQSGENQPGQDEQVRSMEVLLGLTCSQRTDAENIHVFLEGNHAVLASDQNTASTTPLNPLETLLHQEEMESWFMETVDEQLLATINQVANVQVPDNVLAEFTDIVNMTDHDLPEAATAILVNTMGFARDIRQGIRTESTNRNWNPRKEKFMVEKLAKSLNFLILSIL
ncbi:hypothetical protein DFS34DRAFT_379567 [Phlyctochytrium arcticum]|nr:hypothetical protein DFS34DRAFT_379567 [Phlyctochytrium arcticum]